jgi:transposase-like protein
MFRKMDETENTMTREPKAKYTKEFREQAVKLVLVDGLSQLEAAR